MGNRKTDSIKELLINLAALWLFYALLFVVSLFVWYQLQGFEPEMFGEIMGSLLGDLFLLFSDFFLRTLPGIILFGLLRYMLTSISYRLPVPVVPVILFPAFILLTSASYYYTGMLFFAYYTLPAEFWFNAIIATVILLFLKRMRLLFLP